MRGGQVGAEAADRLGFERAFRAVYGVLRSLGSLGHLTGRGVACFLVSRAPSKVTGKAGIVGLQDQGEAGLAGYVAGRGRWKVCSALVIAFLSRPVLLLPFDHAHGVTLAGPAATVPLT
jgi:hypothetical protein